MLHTFNNYFQIQILQIIVVNSVSITNGTFGRKTSNYSILINGFIPPNQTDTYTLNLYSDDSAYKYINDMFFHVHKLLVLHYQLEIGRLL